MIGKIVLIAILLSNSFAYELSEDQEIPTTGVGQYLDLSQHGVSEEYAEYLNIGTADAMREAIKDGVNVHTGIQESGEMMEGILFVYGLTARMDDMKWRIAYVSLLIAVLLGIKGTRRYL